MRRRRRRCVSRAALWLWWLSLHSTVTAFSSVPNEDARRGTDSPPYRQFSAPTTKDNAFFTDTRKKERIKRGADLSASDRPPSAPLVDSTLLRFLSAEKQQQQLAEGDTRPKDDSPLTSALQDTYRYSDSKAANAVLNRLASVLTAESWLGQYNANRVTQALLSTGGVDLELAQRAGQAVQNHVLARTARKRVREFLRQRDLQWIQQQQNESVIATTISGSKLSAEKIAFRPREYRLQDVISVLTDMGLTGTDICTILTHTPSIALMRPKQGETESASQGETLEATTKRAFQDLLCDSLKLRRYDARKILRNSPGLLTRRGSRTAEQIVSLLSNLGVSKGALARDKTGLPVLLSRSPSAVFRLVAFLSSDAVRMSVETIGPLLRRTECLALLNAVAPVPRLQLEQDAMTQIGLQNNSLPTSVSSLWGQSDARERREQINNIYRRMSTTAWTLRHKIGTGDLGKVIAAYPSVVLLDAETQILPVAEYLMHDLGIWEDDLPGVLQLYPALLGMEVVDMKKVASYLQSLGVEEESLGSIFRAFPSLLTLDIDKDMTPVVEYLRHVGITNIGRFITRLPPILGYSVENELVPKFEYLSKVCMDATFQLSTFPAYFSYPLDRKIKARYEYLQDVKRIPSQLLALDVILRFGDRDFATRVAHDDDGGAAFVRFVEKRQARRNGRRAVTNAGKRRKANKLAASATANRPQRGGIGKRP